MGATLKIGRALVSVSDKTGLVGLGQALADAGVELLSTGGTFAALESEGVAVTEVSQHTGHPEMMDVKVRMRAPLEAIRLGPPYLACVLIKLNNMADHAAADWHGSDYPSDTMEATSPAGYDPFRGRARRG